VAHYGWQQQLPNQNGSSQLQTDKQITVDRVTSSELVKEVQWKSSSGGSSVKKRLPSLKQV
jgi:hypothetical protein